MNNISTTRIFLAFVILLTLAGCDVIDGSSSTKVVPTVVLDSGGAPPAGESQGGEPAVHGGVTASGIVVPGEQARLVFMLSGRIESVEVAVGQQVQAGEVLAQLKGKEDLQAAITAADLALASVQKDLDDLKENVSGARTIALERIAAATKAVRDATYTLDNFTIPTEQASMDTNQALELTQTRLDAARAAFEPYRYYPSTNNTREDLLDDLNRAQADYNAAVKRLQYETALEVAQAELDDALADFETLSAGPDPAELSLAEKRVANAQAAADAARAQLDNLELRAPFDGAIARVNVHAGEWVTAGLVVIEMADLIHLRIETTDLSERDIPHIAIGQAVTVYVEALSQEITGKVSEIAPLAETLGGDVVYRTTIDLEEAPAGLRAGMSVEVAFGNQ